MMIEVIEVGVLVAIKRGRMPEVEEEQREERLEEGIKQEAVAEVMRRKSSWKFYVFL